MHDERAYIFFPLKSMSKLRPPLTSFQRSRPLPLRVNKAKERRPVTMDNNRKFYTVDGCKSASPLFLRQLGELRDPASSCVFFASTVDFQVSWSIPRGTIVGKRSFIFDNYRQKLGALFHTNQDVYQRAVLRLASAKRFLNQNALRFNALQGVVDM